MPWKDLSAMDQRREFVSLALQDGANRRELCRRFGISAPTAYKWLARAAEGGVEWAVARSRRPHHSPERTSRRIESAILQVRSAHPAWGARKIARCLERDGIEAPATSTVHAVLQRHGLVVDAKNTKPAVQRFEHPAPNLVWQMDFKGYKPLTTGDRCHPLTIVDDHSRYALCLAACANQQSSTVTGWLTQTFLRYGMPEAFLVDNGSPWGGGAGQRWTKLGVWLLKLGVDVIYSRPYHPQTRGKNERFHRTLEDEIFAFNRFRDLAQAQVAFDRWRTIYNTIRPHQALGQEVPLSRYKPSLRTMPRVLPTPEYHNGDIVRCVGTTKAYISYKNRLWPVPKAFMGERVAVRPIADDTFGIFFAARKIAEIDLRSKPDV